VARARSGHREHGQEQAVRRRGGILPPGEEVLRRGRGSRIAGTSSWTRCANHYRKAGFIREFEKVATGLTPEPEPTFLEKARARWAPPD
jgi:hypothetical protein